MRHNRRRGLLSAIESLEGRVFLSASGFGRGQRIRAIAKPDFQLLRPAGAVADGSPAPYGAVTPFQMRQAYGVNSIKFGSIVGTGAGQTIAIVDAYHDPTAASDLAAFDKYFGLAAPPSFTQLDQYGGTNYPQDATVGTWGVEESLDVQWAHVMAPQASIILYEANSASDTDLINAAVVTAKNNPNVTVVSMSFGGGDYSGENADDPIFTSSHVTFLSSTGDTGSPSGYPAYSPNVIAVGGTTLSVTSSGTYQGESGWSGSGGGFSSNESEPAYQRSVQNSGSRSAPDVSIDANPNSGVSVYDSYDNGSSTPWTAVGGTSLAAPMWGGLIAIADQGRLVDGQPVLNTISNPAAGNKTEALPLLYQAPKSDFHDIVSGNNGGYSATTGYDEVTGIGTPIANLLIPYLAGGPQLPAWLAPSSNATWNSTTHILTVTGTAKIIADPGTAEPIISANGSAAQLTIQPTVSDVDIHIGGIQLNSGAAIDVASIGAGRTHANHNTLVLGVLGAYNDPSFSLGSGSKLNLEDNDMVVHTGTSDPTGAAEYGTVEGLAAIGRNPASGGPGLPDGQWNGSALSSSAVAAADAAAGYEKIGLGVVINNTLVNGTLASWQVGSANETLNPTDVIVKYTYTADYALEGMVADDDAGILQLEYDGGATTDHTWATGSSLFDGKSDDNEAGLMQLQYGLGTGGSNGAQL
jgi:hypothetical protein